MLDKQNIVIHHEMSHLLIYLYLGGKIQDIREMQLKPLSGFFDNRSHEIAEDYFSHCCLALAGPVSDDMIRSPQSIGDINNAKERLRRGLAQNGLTGDKLQHKLDQEYKRAWEFVRAVLIANKELLDRLILEGQSNMNKSKIISKNKIQKIATSIIDYLVRVPSN